MKKNRSTILLVMVLLIGLSLLLYPSFSNYYNSFHQTRAIAHYAEAVANIGEDAYAETWDSARAYNARLAETGIVWELDEEQRAVYEKELNVTGSGIMGYIEIGKLDVFLPIYHGTSDAVLQIAVGHIEGSSLPVGGEGSHCILSGHRGLPSAKLFTDLDDLSEGDVFLLHTLDETLSYQVDQIRIVLPYELDDLQIEAGKDYCTLVTCTPYGINSHRLLVRGHRIENAEMQPEVHVTGDAFRVEPLVVAPILAAPVLLILLLVLLFGGGKSNKKKEKPERK